MPQVCGAYPGEPLTSFATVEAMSAQASATAAAVSAMASTTVAASLVGHSWADFEFEDSWSGVSWEDLKGRDVSLRHRVPDALPSGRPPEVPDQSGESVVSAVCRDTEVACFGDCLGRLSRDDVYDREFWPRCGDA